MFNDKTAYASFAKICSNVFLLSLFAYLGKRNDPKIKIKINGSLAHLCM